LDQAGVSLLGETTMDIGIVLRGVAIGLSIAAPVGPIGLLVIRRTLAEGRSAGLATGLGAAVADGIYGAIAGLGLGIVAEAMASGMPVMRIAGGLFLCYLGIRAMKTPPAERAAEVGKASLVRAFGSTLVLTLTNPMTILSFAAVIASVGLGAADGGTIAAFVAAVFAGSALWWLALSGAVGLLRSRVTPAALVWVNRASGLVIVGFGVAALVGVGS
jgi:threonine/homoserine/homoserine lactone efflux protein